MKYVAIIDSDDELSEEVIKALKDTVFVGDEHAPYCFDITSIKKAPKPRTIEKYSSPVELGYNVALIDCGVMKE